MPPGSSSDDKYFGGQPGSAARAWQSMRRNYGRSAEHVYYGSIAKRKRKHKRRWGRR